MCEMYTHNTPLTGTSRASTPPLVWVSLPTGTAENAYSHRLYTYTVYMLRDLTEHISSHTLTSKHTESTDA